MRAQHPPRALLRLRSLSQRCIRDSALWLLLCILSFATTGWAQDVSEIGQYIQNGGYALQKDRKTLFSKNLTTPFIPASTLKLLTGLAALQILGSDHRFITRLYLDSQKNLYIKGGGDPFLVSEKIKKIAEQLVARGVTTIKDIILDDSAFALEHLATEGSEHSTNPYDANVTALGVNFNTLPLRVIQRAKIQSSESQTPYLPLMGPIGRDLSSGKHRVNVAAFPTQGPLSNSLLYCGQLFQNLLRRQGIQVQGTINHAQVPQNTPLILTYRAPESITDLVKACLLSSSNFMANQLYLAIGVARYGLPATWIKAQKAMATFIHHTLGLNDSQITMVEGSGLSSNNRISPLAMLVVLENFRPYSPLIPLKYGLRMKSGTLKESGVYCYAGFIPAGRKDNPFVILLNQKKNDRDNILKALSQL